MDYSSIGRNIQKIRKQKGITQRELADMTGLDDGYISVIECGNRMPSLKSLISILNALKITSDNVLADVLEAGVDIKHREIDERISHLVKEDADRLFQIMEIMTDKNDQSSV